ncbi:glycosyltransferase involved in cell wall biosynthesis [Nakamurella sp. UYEF19]|uniref:glycosyltransferase family 2 protein n=1 Tax=Nakamurella sp. UYEF19 TaxID=1756392 RepID=UPI003398FEAF
MTASGDPGRTATKAGTVTVALCTYNGANWIRYQVRSIVEQTIPPRQLVLSDDGSTDRTVELALDEFEAAGGDRLGIELVVIRNGQTLGVVANFEQALRASGREFVALSDQDDVWHPRRLERALLAFDRRPSLLLVHCDAQLVDRDGEPLGRTLAHTQGLTSKERSQIADGRELECLVRRRLVTGATVVLRRQLLIDALPIPPRWMHDEWLGVVAAAKNGTDFIDETLVDYRQHGGNQVGVRRRTLNEKFELLTGAGGERNRRLVEQWAALVDRLTLIPDVPPRNRAFAAGRLAHETFRAGLSRNRLRRMAPVGLRAVRGDYRRYARGSKDVLLDLIQPSD